MNERRGFILAFIAVCGFSLGFPMTRVAVAQLDPVIVGLGRGLFAGVLAIIFLLATRTPWPKKHLIFPLLMVSLGVSIAFPLFSSIALQSVPSSHGAIIAALLPLSTTFWAGITSKERPSRQFWVSSLFGCAVVIGYALYRNGTGFLHMGDLLLLVTVIFGGLGYAYGAIAAKEIGGVRVTCWSLVFAMPFLALAVIPKLFSQTLSHSLIGWGAVAYLVVINQFVGMVIWYKALSMGSISRISQTQLLQPFLTIIFATFFMAEHVDALTWVTAAIVLLSVQASRKTVVNVVNV